jgi:hypothetical protein
MNDIIPVFEPYRFRDKDFGGDDVVLDFVYAVTGRSAVQQNPFWLT